MVDISSDYPAKISKSSFFLQQSLPLRPARHDMARRDGWLVQANIACRSIENTGGITFDSRWNRRTFDSRANLEEWQEEKLVEIGFPKSVVENDSQKKAFIIPLRQARVERNIAFLTAEAAVNGTTLPPSGLKAACGGYRESNGHVVVNSSTRFENNVYKIRALYDEFGRIPPNLSHTNCTLYQAIARFKTKMGLSEEQLAKLVAIGFPFEKGETGMFRLHYLHCVIILSLNVYCAIIIIYL